MLRIVLGMIIGAAAGSGLTYYLVAGEEANRPVALTATATATIAPTRVRDALEPTGRDQGAAFEPAPATPTPAERGARGAQAEPTLAEVLAIAAPLERRRALIALAARLAAEDPRAAWAAADAMADRQDRLAFQGTLVRELVRTDPEFLFTHFEDLETPELQASAARALMTDPSVLAIEPERLLAMAESIDAPYASGLRQIAMQRWGEADPEGALAYAEALAPGREREQLLGGAVSGLARRDPEAALAWLAAARNPSEQLRGIVYGSIARSDPSRAIDLLFEQDLLAGSLPQRMSAVMPLITSLAATAGDERANVADRLLTAVDATGRQLVQMFVASWSQQAPNEALTWLARNATAVDANVYQQLAVTVSGADPERAAAFTAQVPAAARESWIVGVAQGYAAHDAEAAAQWLAQYAGQPVYRQAALGVAQAIAGYDAPRAAALLSGTGADDPRVAGIAGQIAYQWSRNDSPAARAWVASLPQGSVRDGALSMLVSTSETGQLDPATLALFSNERARQTAISNLVLRIAQTDERRARGLLDQHITDPAVRARTEQAIENGNAGPGTAFGPGLGRVIVTNDGRTIVR